MTIETPVTANTSTTADVSESTGSTVSDATVGSTGSEDTSESTNTEVAEDSYTIDDLLGEDFSDFEEFAAETNHTGLKPLQEVMKHMIPEGRKHLANLRAMTTRKNQEVAELRKQLAAEREQVRLERESLYNGEFAKSVSELAAEPETPHDVFDADGQKALIKQEAAKMFQDMLKPLQEEQRLSERQSQIDSFKAEHPDLTENPTVKIETFKLLKNRPELKLEDAYFIVKAKHDSEAIAAAEVARKEERSTRRDALKRTSTGTNSPASGQPKFKNAYDAYLWHKARSGK